MNITIIDPSQGTKQLRDLREGDWFVRWALPRRAEDCVVYLRLHDHTRLSQYGKKDETIPTVNIGTGYISNMRPDQPVLQAKEPIGVELDV